MFVQNAKKFFAEITLSDLSIKLKMIMAFWIVLNILDIILTKIVIDNGGIELNPLAAAFISSGNIIIMIIFKIAICIPLLYLFGKFYPKLVSPKKEFIVGIYTGLVAWYALVAIWNLNQIGII
jgi:hypothetical protein